MRRSRYSSPQTCSKKRSKIPLALEQSISREHHKGDYEEGSVAGHIFNCVLHDRALGFAICYKLALDHSGVLHKTLYTKCCLHTLFNSQPNT